MISSHESRSRWCSSDPRWPVTAARVLIAVACVSVLMSGCAVSAPVSRQYSARQVLDREPSDVFGLAETALRDFGLTIASRDVLRRSLTTDPFDGQTRLGVGATPRPPGTYTRRRRVAHVRIERLPGAETVRVLCRVDAQEQTTQSLRMLSLDQRSSDVPDRTPIQREAATTAIQNTVWQTIRRDRAAERAILEAILERTGGSYAP